MTTIMINKILGYVLLVLGVVIMVFTLWQSYNIFTAKVAAPLIFRTQVPLQQSASATDVQKQMNDAVKQQLNQILPPDSITKILNLTSWSLLAFMLIMGGGAVSGIGVKLLNGNK